MDERERLARREQAIRHRLERAGLSPSERARHIAEARHRPKSERHRAKIGEGLRRYWASPEAAERRAAQSAEWTELNRLAGELLRDAR